MPYVLVKYKYSSKEDGNPTSLGTISVQFSKKTPTESEILANIKKKQPKRKNIVITEIIEK